MPLASDTLLLVFRALEYTAAGCRAPPLADARTSQFLGGLCEGVQTLPSPFLLSSLLTLN
jgi:hypothetical protein